MDMRSPAISHVSNPIDPDVDRDRTGADLRRLRSLLLSLLLFENDRRGRCSARMMTWGGAGDGERMRIIISLKCKVPPMDLDCGSCKTPSGEVGRESLEEGIFRSFFATLLSGSAKEDDVDAATSPLVSSVSSLLRLRPRRRGWRESLLLMVGDDLPSTSSFDAHPRLPSRLLDRGLVGLCGELDRKTAAMEEVRGGGSGEQGAEPGIGGIGNGERRSLPRFAGPAWRVD